MRHETIFNFHMNNSVTIIENIRYRCQEKISREKCPPWRVRGRGRGRGRLGIGLGLGSWGRFRGGFFPGTFAIKNKVITFKNFKSNWEFCSIFIFTRNINFLLFCYLLFYLINRHQQNWFNYVKRTLSKKIKDWRMELYYFTVMQTCKRENEELDFRFKTFTFKLNFFLLLLSYIWWRTLQCCLTECSIWYAKAAVRRCSPK